MVYSRGCSNIIIADAALSPRHCCLRSEPIQRLSAPVPRPMPVWVRRDDARFLFPSCLWVSTVALELQTANSSQHLESLIWTGLTRLGSVAHNRTACEECRLREHASLRCACGYWNLHHLLVLASAQRNLLNCSAMERGRSRQELGDDGASGRESSAAGWSVWMSWLGRCGAVEVKAHCTSGKNARSTHAWG